MSKVFLGLLCERESRVGVEPYAILQSIALLNYVVKSYYSVFVENDTIGYSTITVANRTILRRTNLVLVQSI